jgi:hypothetical protein
VCVCVCVGVFACVCVDQQIVYVVGWRVTLFAFFVIVLLIHKLHVVFLNLTIMMMPYNDHYNAATSSPQDTDIKSVDSSVRFNLQSEAFVFNGAATTCADVQVSLTTSHTHVVLLCIAFMFSFVWFITCGIGHLYSTGHPRRARTYK